MDLGSKIKNLRNLHNLTQEELANRCELTKSYISQLENDKTSPSITTLNQILTVLGTDLGEFFYQDDIKKIVYTKEEQYVKNSDAYKTTWLITPSQKLRMEPILINLKPCGETTEDRPHEGEEFGYVVRGEIEIIYGNQTITCKENEGFYYQANKVHYIRNNTLEEATILWVTSPPNF